MGSALGNCSLAYDRSADREETPMDDLERWFTLCMTILLLLSFNIVFHKSLKINVDAKLRHSYQPCSICWETEQSFQMRTECGHSFCGDCIVSYYEACCPLKPLRCPICRRDVHVLYPCFTEEEHNAPSLDPAYLERDRLYQRMSRYNVRFSGIIRPLLHYIKDLPLWVKNFWYELSQESVWTANILLISAAVFLKVLLSVNVFFKFMFWWSVVIDLFLLLGTLGQLHRRFKNYPDSVFQFLKDIYQFTTADGRLVEVAVVDLVCVIVIVLSILTVMSFTIFILPFFRPKAFALCGIMVMQCVKELFWLICPFACVMVLHDVLFKNMTEI